MVHHPIALGFAVACGLFAVLPSKTEDKWRVPWASIALSVISGVCAAVAFS